MADITAKLIAYRLSESFTNMANWYSEVAEWYTHEFSWRSVEILDMLVLGWVLLALAVVGLINIYLHFFGPWRKGLTSRGGRGIGPSGQQDAGETCHWVNAAISWLHSQSSNNLKLSQSWLQALNKESEKNPGPLVLTYHEVKLGNSPPKFTHVTTETGAKDTFTLRTHGEWSEVKVITSAAPGQANSSPNCEIQIDKIKGLLNVFAQKMGSEILVEASFVSTPELTMKVKKSSTQNDLDLRTVERLSKKAIENAVTRLTFSSDTAPMLFGNQATYPDTIMQDYMQPASASTHLNLVTSSIKDKRLLVKVIKANALGDKDYGCCDAYCVVEMDAPPQTHMTSVAHNTSAPFWDEHFLFDLSEKTKAVKFVVYNRDRRPGEDLVGDAVIAIEDVKQTTSSRQIIPLHAPITGANAGSITAEFLMMEPAEAQGLLGNGVSPRRHIETNRMVMPGGTVKTTTTMTTQKSRDGLQPGVHAENPSMVTKSNSSGQFFGEASPYASSLNSSTLPHDSSLNSSQEVIMINGSESVTQTALRELEQKTRTPRTPTKTSTIIITGVHRDISDPKLEELDPEQPQMTDSSPTDDMMKGSPSISTGSSDQKEKKKGGFANTLRKRFGRPKKRRSQSADRATMRGGGEHLLKPPEQHSRTTDDMGKNQEYPEGNLRKSRSHSFSSSLRRLFKKKKKEYGSSRESSISRASRGHEEVPFVAGHRDMQEPGGTPYPGYPSSSSREELPAHSREPSYTHSMPDASYQYSTSVPGTNSYLHD